MIQPHAAARPVVETEPGLEQYARLLQPHLKRLDSALLRYARKAPAWRPYDARQVKALQSVTPVAAARTGLDQRAEADFLEQVSYNSRRLAKLNVAPGAVVDALRDCDAEIDRLLAGRYPRQQGAYAGFRQKLNFHTLLTLHNAYYQVREAETQAFYGLLRAELDASDLEDLLRRFIVILTRTFHAQAGRLIPLPEHPPLATSLLKRLARPRYLAAGREQELILDRSMRGRYQSYWSVPFFADGRMAGLIQFGFSTDYGWLPRELDLLNAFAERCLKAAERARLLQELIAREAQVRALAGHLIVAEDEERRRIGREIHDEAGQSLLFLRLQLEVLEKAAPPALRARLAESRQVIQRVIGEVRRIVAALHPAAVENLGLIAAIRHLSSRFHKLYGVETKLHLRAYAGKAPREIETAVYRLVQECYQNIAKYAQASRVNLRLKCTDKELELNIDDDGIGFDVEAAVAQPKSFGLKGMRERVALLGGRLQIRSSPGKGAAIVAQLPVCGPAAPCSSRDERTDGNSNTPNG